MSKLIEASHLTIIDALKCREIVNTLFINYSGYFNLKDDTFIARESSTIEQSF